MEVIDVQSPTVESLFKANGVPQTDEEEDIVGTTSWTTHL